ncbi:uncharacterized protein ACNLHF_001175 [Anomaloglossus baeobatrachus]|uniref:uncharacterized protein LOC142250657 n=1 Tax=Anomaloglossus baeobatrachus TaxID=238106 RepID=UPI003F4FAEA4
MSSKEMNRSQEDMDIDIGDEGNMSDSVHLLPHQGEEKDEPSTRVRWLSLKQHKKVMSGLSKKASFLIKMTKGGKEEKILPSKAKKAKIHQDKAEDSFSGVSNDKTSRFNYMIGPFKHKASKTAVTKAVSSPLVANLPENGHSPEWAENVSAKSYFSQKTLELSAQLPKQEPTELVKKTDYLHGLPNGNQCQVSQTQPALEKANGPIFVDIADLQVQNKICEQALYLNKELYMSNKDEEHVDPKSVDGLQNPSTHLISTEESSTDACVDQDDISYSHGRDLSLTAIPSSESPKLVGRTPISGSLGLKCCNTEALMKEITAVKTRQHFLENECLQLRSRYIDNNIIIQLLREQHLRYSQLLVDINDQKEQQNVEMENMRESIHSMKEMIAYEYYESTRDIWEEMGLFHRRLSKLETAQKQQSSPASGKEAKSSQIYKKVMNLPLTLVTNISQILSGRVMKNYLLIMTILLIFLGAVSRNDIPFITIALYVPFTVVFLRGVLHHWRAVSLSLRRSWLVTYARHLIHRPINLYDFWSALEEAWELLFSG